MLTSGTLGLPKIVGHTLEGLTGAIAADAPARGSRPIWATFYDIRRYGGLQIFLRAIIGGGSLVLSEPGEALADHVARLNEKAVTHISGTPSHWRKLLMSGAASAFSPGYVRLSGEIADQAVLDGLRQTFPDASIGHAYASTEAGVGFAVNDGREGFPADMIGVSRDGVEMKVVDGCLRIRSTARGACLCRPSRRRADGRRRFRRHWRHGRTAWRPLSLCRPPRRHHQYRRPEGSPRGNRSGDQSRWRGAHVARQGAQKSDHRRHRDRRRRSCDGRIRAAATKSKAASLPIAGPASRPTRCLP